MGADAPLAHIPGPSPWFLQLQRHKVVGSSTWVDLSSRGFPGLSGLTTPNGELQLILGSSCYVLRLPNHLLIWHDSEKLPVPSLDLDLVDLRKLQILDGVREAAGAMSEAGEHIYPVPDAAHRHSIPKGLGAGLHAWTPPPWMTTQSELLALVYGPGHPGPPPAPDLQVWCLRPTEQEIEVIPQTWYNSGPYDHGYQWVTRVARVKGGMIVGEGIRLGVFELDDTGRGIRQWVRYNPFGSEWNAA